MRTLRLARVAAEAEGLRLRYLAKRTARRVVTGLIALVFLAGALAFAHIAVWYWLRIDFAWAPHWAAAVLAGGDLVLAALLMLAAARSSPGRIEMEALELRRRAWSNATGSTAFLELLMPVLRAVVWLLRRGPSRQSGER